MPFIELINNAALLVALALLYDFVPVRTQDRSLRGQVLSGVFLGALGVAVMLNPWELHPGLVFDTRSVLLGIGGLFFGLVPTLIAVAMTAAQRIVAGGEGVWMGLAVIVSSGGTGIIWRRFRTGDLAHISAVELYGFGVLVHIFMVFWTILLPAKSASAFLAGVAFPVLAVYPVGTLLLGKLLSAQRERKLAREELRERKAQLELATRAASVGLWDWNVSTNEVWYSSESRRQLGYGDDEIPNLFSEWRRLLHPDDREAADRRAQEYARNPKEPALVQEFRLQHKDGTYRTILTYASMVRDESGRPVRMMGSHIDITDRRKADEQLRLTQFSVDRAPVPIVWIDAEGTVVYANEKACETVGAPRSELVGGKVWKYDRDQTPDSWKKYIRRLQEGGPPAKEVHLTGSDGATRCVIVTDSYLVHQDRGLLVSFAVDITERKAREEEMRRQKELLQVILDNAPVMMSFRSPDHSYQWANRCWIERMGWSREEIHGRQVLDWTYPDPAYRQSVMDFIARSDGTWKEFRCRRKDGTELDILWASVHLEDGSSIGIGQDITERKKLDARLLDAHRMEAIGQFAGGVAHDFNNLLQSILGYAELAIRETNPADSQFSNLKEIRLAAERAAVLTRQLLAYTRQQVLQLEVLDPNAVVEGMMPMLENRVGSGIAFTFAPGQGVPGIRADRGQFEQVILNLCLNARDAVSRPGGRITVTASAAVPTKEDPQLAKLGHVRHAVIAVVDNGTGMTPEVQSRALEPFFTTKDVGKGVGLGLPTAYGIVTQHGGAIRMESEPGAGSRFEAWFPAANGQPAPPTPLPEEAEETPATILVAEDETSVRNLAVRVLTRDGFNVVAAADGAEAVKLYDKHRGALAAVVLDVMMPNLGGAAVLEHIRRHDANLPVIFTSGYTEEATRETLRLGASEHYIEKPYRMPALTAKIREILAARRGSG